MFTKNHLGVVVRSLRTSWGFMVDMESGLYCPQLLITKYDCVKLKLS